jgi:hypothetical protein
MKIIILFISVLILNVRAYSQHSFGVKLNGGGSKVSNNLAVQREKTVQWATSGSGGFFYKFDLGKGFCIGTELLFLQIRSKEIFGTKFVDNSGIVTGQGTGKDLTSISYLSLPIYIGAAYKKVTFTLGIQLSGALVSEQKSTGTGTIGGVDYAYENTLEGLPIDKYDYGMRLGLIYTLTKDVSLDANYYSGLNNILDDTALSAMVSKAKQLTVGLRLVILKTEKK